MIMLYLPLLAAAILAVINLRLPRDLRPARHIYARTVYYTGLVLLALYAIFWLVFGGGEVIGGDASGIIHLAPAACILLLAALAFRRPFETGIGLIILGAAQAVLLLVNENGGLLALLGLLLLAAVPFLVVGLLFVAAYSMSLKEA